MLVLLGDVLSNAYQKAQLEQGIFNPETMSVGDLFAGALIPGLMLVVFYILYQVYRAVVHPASSPDLPADESLDRGELYRKTFRALVPPVLLIVAVLGSILGGIATPTEAAAVGAVGALLLAGYRQAGSKLPVILAAGSLIAILVLTSFYDLRITRDEISAGDSLAILIAALLAVGIAVGVIVSALRLISTSVLQEVMRATTRTSSMVFVILIGAALFSLVFRGLGGDETVQDFLMQNPDSWTAKLFGDMAPVFIVMAVMFVLGFFLDFIEITFVVVPIVGPVLLGLGFDPVWLGVMMAINLQTSFLTPPFGFALFYLRGVAPDTVRTVQIYRGVVPFVAIQILALIIIANFPGLATWLPQVVFG